MKPTTRRLFSCTVAKEGFCFTTSSEEDETAEHLTMNAFASITPFALSRSLDTFSKSQFFSCKNLANVELRELFHFITRMTLSLFQNIQNYVNYGLTLRGAVISNVHAV